MSAKTIFIRTDGAGAFTYTRNFKGVIHALEFQIGDLSTPDIDVTDATYSTSFLSVNGVAADTVYRPGQYLDDDAGADLLAAVGTKLAAPAVCLGLLTVAVTGGGASKRGKLIILYS